VRAVGVMLATFVGIKYLFLHSQIPFQFYGPIVLYWVNAFFVGAFPIKNSSWIVKLF